MKPIFLLILAVLIASCQAERQDRIVIEAEDMYSRQGVPIEGGIAFYRNGFVSKEVIIPKEWIGRNVRTYVVAKADKYAVEPPSMLDWSYNVTTLLENRTIPEVLTNDGREDTVEVRITLKQKGGLVYSYNSRINYSELRDYILSKQQIALQAKEGPIRDVDNKSITGVEFSANSITTQYEWKKLYFPKYAVVVLSVNDEIKEKIGIDSENWKNFEASYPFVPESERITVEVAYIDDIYAEISISDEKKKLDRNFYIDRVELRVEG